MQTQFSGKKLLKLDELLLCYQILLKAGQILSVSIYVPH